jgi:hypothetical protein
MIPHLVPIHILSSCPLPCVVPTSGHADENVRCCAFPHPPPGTIPLRTPLRLLRLRLTPLLTSAHSHCNHPRHSTIQCPLVTVWLPPLKFCGHPSTRIIQLTILRLRWAWWRTLWWLWRFGRLTTPLLAAAHGYGDHTPAYGAVQGALVAVGCPAWEYGQVGAGFGVAWFF